MPQAAKLCNLTKLISNSQTAEITIRGDYRTLQEYLIWLITIRHVAFSSDAVLIFWIPSASFSTHKLKIPSAFRSGTICSEALKVLVWEVQGNLKLIDTHSWKLHYRISLYLSEVNPEQIQEPGLSLEITLGRPISWIQHMVTLQQGFF